MSHEIQNTPYELDSPLPGPPNPMLFEKEMATNTVRSRTSLIPMLTISAALCVDCEEPAEYFLPVLDSHVCADCAKEWM